MQRLQVGPIDRRWFIGCECELWPSSGSGDPGVPQIDIGDAEEGAAERWVITLCDAATRSPVLHLKLTASVTGASHMCIFENRNAFIAVDCTVASVDLQDMKLAWERTFMTPMMDCWTTPLGLMVVGEGDLAMLDAAGRTVWERSTDDLVIGYERVQSLLRVTLDSGDVLEIDEATGRTFD
ncbi:MAG: hypothetical protein JJU33_13255 [Phycisphaerales bacterium]|nr:hypothetical protein [Phycisphaerales bacterium]